MKNNACKKFWQSRLLLALFAFVWAGVSVFAQTKTVSGTVRDVAGEPVIGANVVVVGTTHGIMTDLNGHYSLSGVANDAILKVTFIGYAAQEIPVAGKSTVNVVLEEENDQLDEVVVVGYGLVKKRDLTGSVASIKAADIQGVATSNAMQAMQAKVPGIDIRQSDGQAGSGLSMTLRGNRSISASNSPLILVDGVEYGSTLDINPSDIESMEILKDASSTAIYGTRGANGVIIITTKRGKAGKTQVNFNAYLSSNQPTNVPKVMYGRKEVQRLIDKANYQADEKLVAAGTGNWGDTRTSPESVLTETLADGTSVLSIYEDGSYTDWADEILQNGLTQNYELSVAGGNDKTNFAMSLGAMFEEGLLKNDALDRYNLKVNVDHKINKAVKAGASLLYTYKNHDKRNSNVFSQSMKMTTITHAYLKDGSINATPNPWYAAHCNPLLDEVDGAFQNNIETTRFFGNAYLEITPVKNLVFKSLFALDRKDVRTGLYQDMESVGRYQTPTTSYISNTREATTAFTWDNTLNYMTDFGGSKHELAAMVGTSATQSIFESLSVAGDAGAEHYKTSSFYDVLKIGSPVPASAYIKQSMFSYFGRLSYNYAHKYLLSATFRADGSSVLADGNKWGYFPSVAAAWRLIDEDWMKDAAEGWLSNLKLRASWGMSGNAAVDPYQTVTALGDHYVYYYLGAADIQGKIPAIMGNSDLTWETTKSWNFGLDFGIIDNRVSGSIDYYISKTDDLLYFKTASASTAFPTSIANVGETEGQGLEISLNTLAVKTDDFTWDINWSYSTSKDEVTKLSDGMERNISGVSGQIVGEPVSIFYDYEADGCWNVGEYEAYLEGWKQRHPGETPGFVNGYGAPGTMKIIDRDDNGKLDDNDKKVYDRTPKHILGMNNTFTYKDWSLSVLLYARLGGYISYDMNSQMNYESANWGDLDYWTPANVDAKFPNPGAEKTTFSTYGTALKYEKADYFKIKDITLTYTLPKDLLGKCHLGSAKIYGSLKNFFTFSDIDNYDPERGGAISFPLSKQVVVGVNVSF